ncbi:MAG: glycosyltransferase family 4 protein [Actinomycetia bacterium]|nr:glycosyltransferase family 4 protein [Actinomycetes bacterium]MCP3993344.1 glycosyltransferase family 4 protein [Actinomycetes bacterium]MCP4085949.1 glycosyltransferase family 4 protein [Actinomycetes bacterium]
MWLEATTLSEAGHDVTIICPATQSFPDKRERLEGIQIHRFAVKEGRSPLGLAVEFLVGFTSVSFRYLVLRAKGPIAVLHVCNPPEIYWPLGLLARATGTRFVFDHHDLSPEMYRAKFKRGPDLVYRALLFLERRTYRSANAVITTNESYREIVTARTGTPPEIATIVRSGPSVARFQKHEPDLTLRRGSEHLMVFLGEIGEQDGVETLIQVAAVLRERGVDVHTLVIGDGPALQSTQELADRLGVAGHCTFAGRVSDDDQLSRMLSSADVGVVPDPNTDWSRHSTMNKVMEYMFFGLPVAAFDLIETRFSAQGAALYARPDDIDDLASVTQRLLEDPELRVAMGQVGEDRLHEELSWEHSVPELLGLYRRLLAST